jgi:hypothetical protein
MLGHIMRAAYFTRLALILGWQAMMIAVGFYFVFSASFWILTAMILPLVAYFWAFYDAPIFLSWSRIKRQIILTFSFIGATIVGFFVLFYSVFIALYGFGGHHF